MKWIIALLFLIGIAFLIIKTNFNDSKSVYLEYNDNTYERFYLNVERMYLTTKNINKYFNNIKILGVLPLFNSLYQTYYTVNWYYFSDSGNTLELQTLEVTISNILKSKNFIKEVENIYFNGVRIKTVFIETTYQDIKNLQLKLPNVVII